jgi:hypothetical protein
MNDRLPALVSVIISVTRGMTGLEAGMIDVLISQPLKTRGRMSVYLKRISGVCVS